MPPPTATQGDQRAQGTTELMQSQDHAVTRIVEDFAAEFAELPAALRTPRSAGRSASPATPAPPVQPAAPARPAATSPPADDGLTIQFRPEPEPAARPTAPAAATAAVAAVVGWLVTIDGPGTGREHRLIAEGNTIGRAPDNLVILPDPSLSERDSHATLYFDPAAVEPAYYLQPGSRHIVYLNGAPIFATARLQSHDVVKLGATQLLFVPLCSERFRWPAGPPLRSTAGT